MLDYCTSLGYKETRHYLVQVFHYRLKHVV